MKARKTFLEAFFDATERGWPKDHPSEDQEWRSDGAWEQQSTDPADDQQDAQLFGHAQVRRVSLAIVRRLTRESYCERAIYLSRSIHFTPLFAS
jgi:hypothetical protein